MRRTLIGLIFIMMTATAALTHSWYDPDCCGGNDCEPVKVQVDNDGNFVVLKNGQKWRIDKPRSVRPSKDDNYHVCIFLNQVWCLYVPTGG
jgi:hypothetical protein